jgi:aminocarboxymuconate-semialdehyde decarboxylase
VFAEDVMKDSERASRPSVLGRRGFIKAATAGTGAGLGAIAAMQPASAVAAETPMQPWWDARPSSAKANRPVAIDLHAHWVPPPYAKAMADLGRPLGNPFPLELDIDQRRKWMDEHGVQMHVLTLNGGMPWQLVTPEQGVRLAQIVNDAGVEAHTAFPDRYLASIELPIRDADLALKELNRVAGKPGLRAVHLPDSIDNRDYLFQPEFAPLLARIEELGYPILFHNLNSDLFGKRPADAGLDNTFAHAVLAAKFISTGTLDKFPKLEVVLPHAGGAFPYVAGRLEHFQDHMGADRPKPARPFKTYLRRFHYDYLTYHPEGLRFLISLVGSDRIVVGTDSFNARDIEYPSAVVDQFKLPASDRDRILKGNAIRLFRL